MVLKKRAKAVTVMAAKNVAATVALAVVAWVGPIPVTAIKTAQPAAPVNPQNKSSRLGTLKITEKPAVAMADNIICEIMFI
jgi:hypothetical protein